MTPKRSPLLSALVTAGMVVSPTVPGVAPEEGPANTVVTFYDRYLARHGDLLNAWSEVEGFFDPDLHRAMRRLLAVAAWDPFSNSSERATAYEIGAVRSSSERTEVEVELQLGGSGKSHVTVILHLGESGYVIDNLRYAEPLYCDAGSVPDLVKFLSVYNR